MTDRLLSGASTEQELDAALFGLGPADFVETCAQRLGLTEAELPASERTKLTNALLVGRSRLDVIKALRLHTGADPMVRNRTSPLGAVMHVSDTFLVRELLTRFAPEDDNAFVNHACLKILNRRPTDIERLPMEFDLRRKQVDRDGIVSTLMLQASREGRVVDCVGLHERSAEAGDNAASWEVIALPALGGIDRQGRETVTLCEADGSRGWRVMADHLLGSVRFEGDIWRLEPGFLLAGPKATLRPGIWRLAIEVVQEEEATLGVDVVANGALDVLAGAMLVGSFAGALAIAVQPHHLFVEVRLCKPAEAASRMWLRMGRVLLTRLGNLQ